MKLKIDAFELVMQCLSQLSPASIVLNIKWQSVLTEMAQADGELRSVKSDFFRLTCVTSQSGLYL